MRQYLVLGFTSNSVSEPGKYLYLGTDRGAALLVANKPGREVRRELYDLAHPHLRRHFAPAVADNDDDQDPDHQDPDGQDPDDQEPDDQEPDDHDHDAPAAKSGRGKK